jgi:hypothetical protein
MWIFWRFAFCMMFAMNRRPFFGNLTCGQPKPETEKVTWNSMQIQSAMRLATMQENRHTGNRDVRDNHSENKDLPATCSSQSIHQKLDGGVDKITQDKRCSII